jgi:hypothetical protein
MLPELFNSMFFQKNEKKKHTKIKTQKNKIKKETG